jgi:hypothetical protein
MTATVASRVVETKRMLKAAQEGSGVQVKSLAAQMDVTYPYAADALNECEPQRFPLDLLVPFMRATSLEPLRWLAQQMGCSVVQLPSVPSSTGDISARFLKVVEELGQDSAAITRALSDGEITGSEGQTIAAELRDTIDALLEVEAAVRANVERRPAAKMPLAQPQERRMRA